MNLLPPRVPSDEQAGLRAWRPLAWQELLASWRRDCPCRDSVCRWTWPASRECETFDRTPDKRRRRRPWNLRRPASSRTWDTARESWMLTAPCGRSLMMFGLVGLSVIADGFCGREGRPRTRALV